MDFSIICSLYPILGIIAVIFGLLLFSGTHKLIGGLIILAGVIILGVWFFNLLNGIYNAISNPLGLPWWCVEAV